MRDISICRAGIKWLRQGKESIFSARILVCWMCAMMFFLASMPNSRIIEAQGLGWSKPYLIFETRGAVYMTDLVADAGGNVHAVWESRSTPGSSNVESDSAIYYSARNSRTGSWTVPVDVLFERGGLRFPNLVIGTDSKLHLFATGYCLLHASAPLSPFPLASSLWKRNQSCIDGPSFEFGATSDTRGNLHLAYTDTPPHNVFYVVSSDSGHTWSAKSYVWQADADTSVDRVRLAVSSDGVIHVVWSAYPLPEAYPSKGVYYSQSRDGGKTWTFPRQLAGANYTEPRVITKDKEVHVLINGAAGIGSRHHIYSSDGGRTWSALQVAMKVSAGSLGAPAGVFDGLGHLHMVAGTNEGVRYSEWDGRSWSPPEVLFTPASNPKDDTGNPSVVLTKGNELHVIYRDLDKRIYYSTKTISAPSVPLTGLPTQPPETRTAIPTAAPSATATAISAKPSPVPKQVDAPYASNQSNMLPIIFGAGASILVILLGVGAKSLRR